MRGACVGGGRGREGARHKTGWGRKKNRPNEDGADGAVLKEITLRVVHNHRGEQEDGLPILFLSVCHFMGHSTVQLIVLLGFSLSRTPCFLRKNGHMGGMRRHRTMTVCRVAHLRVEKEGGQRTLQKSRQNTETGGRTRSIVTSRKEKLKLSGGSLQYELLN